MKTMNTPQPLPFDGGPFHAVSWDKHTGASLLDYLACHAPFKPEIIDAIWRDETEMLQKLRSEGKPNQLARTKMEIDCDVRWKWAQTMVERKPQATSFQSTVPPQESNEQHVIADLVEERNTARNDTLRLLAELEALKKRHKAMSERLAQVVAKLVEIRRSLRSMGSTGC